MRSSQTPSPIDIFNSLEEVQQWVLGCLLDHGRDVAPRALGTREIGAVKFSICNPRRRCITNPVRRWSLALAIGEFCWHRSGSDKLDFIQYYAPRWREFSDDNATIRGSCYGAQIFQPSGARSQWERLKALLRYDESSRRAVLVFNGLDDHLDPMAPDIPCACTLQFLIRSGCLDAIAYMRSNDAILGLPYDVFLFTMLQELLACELGITLGVYHHVAGSLHIYERNLELGQRIVDAGPGSEFQMPPMNSPTEIPTFLFFEDLIRRGGAQSSSEFSGLSPFWHDLLTVLLSFWKLRRAPSIELADPHQGFMYETFIPLFGKP